MTSSIKKEFLFISVITAVSLVWFFSVYTGYDAQTVEIHTHELQCKPHNCFSSQKDTSPFAVYHNGYVYRDPKAYHGLKNMAMVPTAPQWNVPGGTDPAQLFLFDNNGKYNIMFHCPARNDNKLPVVLLVTDARGMMSNGKGIYVEGDQRLWGTAEKFSVRPWTVPANYFKRGKEQKRSAFMVYYNEKGDYQASAEVKLQVTGNATRSFPQKSLRLDINKKKGIKTFPVSFFDEGDRLYSSVVLRNGGNDWSKTLISDGVMQTALKPTGLDLLEFKPCIVYINGLYWGIHSLRTRSDEDFIAEKYGVKSKKVTFMENWEFQKGDEDEFKSLMKLVKKCKKGNDPGLVEKLNEVIDLDQLILYFTAQMYYVNTDWPRNNIKAYKITAKELKTKWRFILFDLDYGMGYTGKNAVNKDMFDYLRKHDTPMGWLFKTLMQDETFRGKLRSTMLKLADNELSPAHLEELILAYSKKIEPEIPYHIQRWRKPAGTGQWKKNTGSLVDFAKQRNKIFKAQVQRHLGN